MNPPIGSVVNALFRTVYPLAVALTLLPVTLAAEQTLSETYLSVRGGKLYDNWAATLKIKPPTTTHPSYPASGKSKGAATWRCKECHGWDYQGNQGRYKEGEHATGIKGIRQWQDKDAGQMATILRDKTHGYTPAMLSDDAVKQLAVFVTKGQVAMEEVIDPATGKAKGEPQKGIELFQTVCMVCHGLDGRKLNFGSEREPEFLGTAANENPWETLHKIRNGQPAQEMISLRALTLQQQVDVLSYTQTLPVK